MAGARQGVRILSGRAYEAEQILPFRPWIDALRAGRVLADLEGPSSRVLAWRNELARLFPELAGPGAAPPITPESHVRLFELVDELVARVASRQPVLLILEDLHWADEMSLRLLSFVGRHAAPRSLLVLGTARDEELADAPVTRALRVQHGQTGAGSGSGRQQPVVPRASRSGGVGAQRGQPLRDRRDRARPRRWSRARNRGRDIAPPRAGAHDGPAGSPEPESAPPRGGGLHHRARVQLPAAARRGRALTARNGGGPGGAGPPPHPRGRRRALRLHPRAHPERDPRRPPRASPSGAARGRRRCARTDPRRPTGRGVRRARLSLRAGGRAIEGLPVPRRARRQDRAQLCARRRGAPVPRGDVLRRSAAGGDAGPPACRSRPPPRPRPVAAGPLRREPGSSRRPGGPGPEPPGPGPDRAPPLLGRVHVRQHGRHRAGRTRREALARGGRPGRRRDDHGEGQLSAGPGELYPGPAARRYRPRSARRRPARANRGALVAGPHPLCARAQSPALRRLRAGARGRGPHPGPRTIDRRHPAADPGRLDRRTDPLTRGRSRDRHLPLPPGGGPGARPGGARHGPGHARPGLPGGRRRPAGHRRARARARGVPADAGGRRLPLRPDRRILHGGARRGVRARLGRRARRRAGG